MRRLVAAGGLAIAACCCGLLFSGAASARESTVDSINVVGVITGTSPSGTKVRFTATGSPFEAISFSGGSNYHFSAVSGVAWTCGLTPTNSGASCYSTAAATSYTVDATISGTLPPDVDGQIGYADASTGTFSAPVSAAPSECRCTKLSAELTGFKDEAEHHGHVLVFFLKWRLSCVAGTEPDCQGLINVERLHNPIRPHLTLRFPPASPNVTDYGEGIHIFCKPRAGKCNETTDGEEKFELIGHRLLRADLKLVFHVSLICFSRPNKKDRDEELIVKFDDNGSLDYRHSHLGKLG